MIFRVWILKAFQWSIHKRFGHQHQCVVSGSSGIFNTQDLLERDDGYSDVLLKEMLEFQPFSENSLPLQHAPTIMIVPPHAQSDRDKQPEFWGYRHAHCPQLSFSFLNWKLRLLISDISSFLR